VITRKTASLPRRKFQYILSCAEMRSNQGRGKKYRPAGVFHIMKQDSPNLLKEVCL
jgi:hypothetical protein